MKSSKYNDVARTIAEDAYENQFRSRRGISSLEAEDQPVIAIYNNNPYEGDPERRDGEIQDTIDKLASQGVGVLGRGSYPREGDEQEGYTVAVVFDGGDEIVDQVMKAYEAATAASRRSAG